MILNMILRVKKNFEHFFQFFFVFEKSKKKTKKTEKKIKIFQRQKNLKKKNRIFF